AGRITPPPGTPHRAFGIIVSSSQWRILVFSSILALSTVGRRPGYSSPASRPPRGNRMDTISALGDLARAQLDGALIDSSHAQYDRLRRVNNALVDRQPAAIVRAMSASDVQKVVRIAAEHGVLLAVRCGGHSCPGLSTCDDGM